MLADHDLDVHAEIARPAQHLDDASGRRDAAAREARQLDLHDRAIEFAQAAARRVPGFAGASPSFARSSGVNSSPGGMTISCVRRVS